MKEIVIATKNKHKIIEFEAKLAPLGYKILSLFDFDEFPEIIEDKNTFRGNALKKAQELGDYLNKIVIADDSGLEVLSLHNEPGVYSARYAGDNCSYEDNNKLLLKNLTGVEERNARFVTCMCIYEKNSEPIYFEDYLNGTIATQYKGANGFGYDPLFIPEGDTRHLAEYSLLEKNQISHRGKCLNQLVSYLKSL